ncbi:eukaryotic translation initiation factor 2D isoform X2 [Polyodon spathula]|uniref:eukaryotic translation initiation factor 2D isoform X2 n=1 Tax=Polyodon spathula TaxID=7913 RepID=UPI001B7E3400|nr:eukaryotic translation initiation factor 2D isoform X2 [Polyodon spathula]
MFAKPFRVKSNIAIKGSDRRKLKADISTAFPMLSAEQISEVIPNKEDLNVVKIYTHKGDSVTLYVLHKNPIFFEVERKLYPTVYTLWLFPDLLPVFTTWPAVLQKLAGGADLMLPGVVVPPSGLPGVKQGCLCAITVVRNRAPVGIGTATMSTAEMLGAGMKGKGLSVFHTYTDQLWAFGDKSSPPTIAPSDPEPAESEEHSEESDGGGGEEEEKDLGPSTDTASKTLQDQQTTPHCAEPEEKAGEGSEEAEEDGRTPQEQMDELLLQCFLHALKIKVKKSDLPLLTSTFLRNHMFSCCPSGKQLDIKKSSYKKLSKFLKCMQQQRKLIQVKELSKGVESIVEVDWKHREKGSVLTAAEVRTIITNYVKNNELVDEINKNYVTINPILCDSLLDKQEYQEIEKLKWDDLFNRCLDRMQHCHQLLFPGQEPIIRKGHIEPIDITVASRGANKKVTLIKNLELYGLEPHAIASSLQQRVQASCAVNPLPGSKDKVLVQIQGNQVVHVGRLLVDEYKIPRKHILGLDKAPKPGKKK